MIGSTMNATPACPICDSPSPEGGSGCYVNDISTKFRVRRPAGTCRGHMSKMGTRAKTIKGHGVRAHGWSLRSLSSGRPTAGPGGSTYPDGPPMRSTARLKWVPRRGRGELQIADLRSEPESDAGSDRHQHYVLGGQRRHDKTAHQ